LLVRNLTGVQTFALPIYTVTTYLRLFLFKFFKPNSASIPKILRTNLDVLTVLFVSLISLVCLIASIADTFDARRAGRYAEIKIEIGRASCRAEITVEVGG